MIPNKTHEAATVSTNMLTAEASVALTPEIFELLSAGIYEDRILAIIRELLCNGRDAQVEVNETRPLEVILPTYLEPSITFRDFGTGLTHDQVFSIYLSYGTSTKRESNSMIGMFGIGSKSPLSYTDNFIVTSYIDGKALSYSIYKDAGFPKVAKISETPSDEPNGLEIKIAVELSDIGSFNNKLSLFLKLFDYPVNVVDEDAYSSFSSEEVEYLHKGDNYWLVSPHHYSWGTYALIAGVPYKISNTQSQRLTKALGVDSIILPFNIGDLNIASSRENLSFIEGDATDMALTKRIDEVLEEFYENLQEEISACNTVLDVVLLLQRGYKRKRPLLDSNINTKLSWGGKTLEEWYKVSTDRYPSTVVTVSNLSRRVKHVSSNIYSFLQTANAMHVSLPELGEKHFSFIFLESDRKSGRIKVAKEIVNNSRLEGKKVVVLLDPTEEQKEFVLETYCKDVPTYKVSEKYAELFPAMVRDKTKQVRRKVTGVSYKEKGNIAMDVNEIDQDEVFSGYYLEMERNSVFFGSSKFTKDSHLMEKLSSLLGGIWFIRGTASKKNRPKGLELLTEDILVSKFEELGEVTIDSYKFRQMYETVKGNVTLNWALERTLHFLNEKDLINTSDFPIHYKLLEEPTVLNEADQEILNHVLPLSQYSDKLYKLFFGGTSEIMDKLYVDLDEEVTLLSHKNVVFKMILCDYLSLSINRLDELLNLLLIEKKYNNLVDS